MTSPALHLFGVGRVRGTRSTFTCCACGRPGAVPPHDGEPNRSDLLLFRRGVAVPVTRVWRVASAGAPGRADSNREQGTGRGDQSRRPRVASAVDARSPSGTGESCSHGDAVGGGFNGGRGPTGTARRHVRTGVSFGRSRGVLLAVGGGQGWRRVRMLALTLSRGCRSAGNGSAPTTALCTRRSAVSTLAAVGVPSRGGPAGGHRAVIDARRSRLLTLLSTTRQDCPIAGSDAECGKAASLRQLRGPASASSFADRPS